MTNWFIAKSKPQKETWLNTSLTHLGVEVFFPRIICHRRGKRILEPLFPTYLFCRFDINTPDWPSIRWAPGLNYFLGTEGRPARIPDDLVDYIKQRVDNWNSRESGVKQLHPGDRVMITNGPFAGLEGIFERYVSSRQRCRVLLQVVGRLSPVEISEGDLALPMPRL